MQSILYTSFTSPFGPMGIVRSEKGICRILFPEEHPFHDTLSILYPYSQIKESVSSFQEELRQLKRYFSWEKTRFHFPIDLNTSRFYRKVLIAVSKIPYGKTFSYKEIAEQVGNPGAARAVGSANAQNPIPIIIPCHRVVSQNGSLGGYGGSPERKYYLLKMEDAI